MKPQPTTTQDTPPLHPFLAHLPRHILPYVLLSRIHKPSGFLLLFIPALFGNIIAFHNYPPTSFSSFFFTPCILLFACILARAIGCCWNDIQDQHFDALVSRTKNRPLPAKTISTKQALLFMVFLITLALPLLFFLPLSILPILPLIASLVFFYPFAKRFTFWPQLILGLTFNSTIFIGWLAASSQPLTSLLTSPETFIAYFASVFWTLGYDTIYAYQDIKDDTKIGVKSTAQLFPHSPLPVFSAFFLFALIISCSHLLISQNTLFSLALLPAYLHTTFILLSWNISSPKSAQHAFSQQPLTGFLLALGLAFPLPIHSLT